MDRDLGPKAAIRDEILRCWWLPCLYRLLPLAFFGVHRFLLVWFGWVPGAEGPRRALGDFPGASRAFSGESQRHRASTGALQPRWGSWAEAKRSTANKPLQRPGPRGLWRRGLQSPRGPGQQKPKKPYLVQDPSKRPTCRNGREMVTHLVSGPDFGF